MKKFAFLAALLLASLPGAASACWYPSFNGSYALQPTFQAYSVPVTYSFLTAIPVGVVQQTYQVTQPQQAALVGAAQQYTTETIVQQPVQATALYVAPTISYSTPLLYGASSYSNYAQQPLFFDRATLGVNYGYGNSFIRFASAYGRAYGFNDVGFRGNVAIAGRGINGGGTSVAIAQSRGLFGNRQAVAVSGGGGAAVATARGGLFGGRSATAVAANGGTAVAHAGRR
jgi:hypothetical protein